MAILYVEGQQVSGAVDNAASISCLDKNGNKSNVQAELDKKGNGSGAGFEPVKMTQAEYDALPEAQQKSGAYLITDAKKLDALEVGFDDTETGLGVDNVQDAIVEQSKKFATPTLLITVTSFNKEYTKVSGINWKNYKKLIFEVVVWYSDADIEYSFVEYDTNLVRTNVAYRLCPYITQNGTLTSCVELKAMFTSNGELKIMENQETWYIKEVKIYGK